MNFRFVHNGREIVSGEELELIKKKFDEANRRLNDDKRMKDAAEKCRDNRRNQEYINKVIVPIARQGQIIPICRIDENLNDPKSDNGVEKWHITWSIAGGPHVVGWEANFTTRSFRSIRRAFDKNIDK